MPRRHIFSHRHDSPVFAGPREPGLTSGEHISQVPELLDLDTDTEWPNIFDTMKSNGVPDDKWVNIIECALAYNDQYSSYIQGVPERVAARQLSVLLLEQLIVKQTLAESP